MAWRASDIPPQTGKVAVITGASLGGIGFETARALAHAGAHVILAGRNEAKQRDALARLAAEVPNAHAAAETLDLAELASVARFAERVSTAHPKLDLLINNAGVMAPPKRQTTKDGFELQFGTNHLGHFALTGHLLPRLRLAPGARVVNVSSLAHRQGAIRFNDLQTEHPYIPWRAYSQSKLANLLFTMEFNRRSEAGGWGVIAAAAHPGFARTELIPNGPGDMGPLSDVLKLALSHTPADGALPTLLAATAPQLRGGEYYGPNGLFELKGPPALAGRSAAARDAPTAKRLWEISEQLTGVRFG